MGHISRQLKKRRQAYQRASNATVPAKVLAAQYGVELHAIDGSGTNGRILKVDVVNYIAEHGIPEPDTTEEE